MPKYARVPDGDVDPNLRALVDDIVRRALPELDLGATPEIGWFADTRELTSAQREAATEVFVPGDGIPKAGSVPPFVSYATAGGWEPAAPLILLNRKQCLPDTPLHELRHLWQIKAGVYRADQYSSQELEDDADAWAAGAMVRLGISPAIAPARARRRSIVGPVTRRIDTDRLVLVPLRPEDAAEMVHVLADPTLYAFIGGEPPTLDELETQYRAWVAGSPRLGDTWHNWVVRLGGEGADGPAIGHVQATAIDGTGAADIAWVIGTVWQGHGYASEAAQALVRWLETEGVATVTAHVHPAHAASRRVAANAGLHPTTEMEEGEVVWRRDAARPGRC